MVMIIGSGLIVACVSFFIAAVQAWTFIAGLFFVVILGLLYLLHDFLDNEYFHENPALKKYHRVGLSYFIDRNTGLPVNVKASPAPRPTNWGLSQLPWLKSSAIKVDSVKQNGHDFLPAPLLHQMQQPQKKSPRYPLQTYRHHVRELPEPVIHDTVQETATPEDQPPAGKTLKRMIPHTAHEFRKSALQTVADQVAVNPIEEKLKSQGHSQIAVISVAPHKVAGSTLQLLDQLNAVLPKPFSKDLIIVDSPDPRHQEKGLVSHLNGTFEYEDIICEGLLSNFDVIPGVGRNWLDFSIRMNHFFSKAMKNYNQIYIVCASDKEVLWKSSVNTLSSLQTTVFQQPLNHEFQ